MGQLGEGWSKRGQFTSNLRGRWTIPVTTGGWQVSRRGHEGEQGGAKGSKGELARGKGSQGRCAMYICNCVICANGQLNVE